MPTAEKTLRSSPWQFGQMVSASSVNFCTTSSASPQSLHWYWYVGTGNSFIDLALWPPERQLCGIRAGTVQCGGGEP
jgi:hypothetical protein